MSPGMYASSFFNPMRLMLGLLLASTATTSPIRREQPEMVMVSSEGGTETVAELGDIIEQEYPYKANVATDEMDDSAIRRDGTKQASFMHSTDTSGKSANLTGIVGSEGNYLNYTGNASNSTGLQGEVWMQDIIGDDDKLKMRILAIITFGVPLFLLCLCLQGPGFDETQPAPATAEGSGETMQAVFESVDVSSIEQKTFFETIYREKGDATIPELLENPGIYTIVWATRTITLDQSLVFMLAITLQIFLPLFLFEASGYGKQRLWFFPPTSSQWAQKIWPAIMVFVISTIKGTAHRTSGMLVLRRAVNNGWGSVLSIGAATLGTSCLLTLLATKSMFYDDPTVRDMLLNACAVNFIPDLDRSLVQLCGIADPRSVRHLAVAKERLTKLAEAWPESNERKEFRAWFKLPTLREQFWDRPYIFIIAALDIFMALLCLGLVGTYYIEMGDAFQYWFHMKPMPPA